MSRLVVANLHGEALLSRATGAAQHALPATLMQRLSATGTLLRVFCDGTDRLWTPLPVDPSCLPELAGREAPRLIHTELPRRLPDEQLVPWMASPLGECIPERAVDVARRVCHRGFALDLCDRLGLGLPGARLISSTAELQEHLADGGARAGADGRWVLKPPYSAAGRGQLLSAGASAQVAPGWERRVCQAFERHGEMLFEPWLDRVHDLGCRGEVSGGQVHVLGVHGLVVGASGAFAGVVVAPAGAADRAACPPAAGAPQAIAGLTPEVAEQLADVTRRVGLALAQAGHAGPFGVDGFTHRQAHGQLALRVLCEINARLTFGRVAAEWMSLLAPSASAPGRLLFARGPLDAAVAQRRGEPAEALWASAQPRVIPLLTPDPAHGRGGTSAWLEVSGE